MDEGEQKIHEGTLLEGRRPHNGVALADWFKCSFDAQGFDVQPYSTGREQVN